MKPRLATFQLSYGRHHQSLFSDLNLALDPGRGLVIQGPNGSGKSSLLRVLTGLISPSSGHIEWEGQAINSSFSTYHQALHYLGHYHGLKNKLSVKENIIYNQKLAYEEGGQKPLALARMNQALERVQLLPYQNQLVQHLSAGQKRRLALARLLASPKPLWILDEPFTNLDQESQAWFCLLLEEHLQTGGMLVVATHQALTLKCEGALELVALPLEDSRHV